MAIGELDCPSYDYVLRMSWAEFRIRLFSYNRQEKNDWYKVREVCYQIYVSNWQNPKKKPISKERYLPLNSNPKRGGFTDAQLKRILEVKEVYNNKKQNGRKVIS